MKDLKFFDKYYVGLRKESDRDTDVSVLGFATPYANDKAFESRKETVDAWTKWRCKETGAMSPITIDNTAQYGFKIIDTVTRYRGNKKFRIYDPRGFELEISAYNLFDIINTTTISKGVIAAPMLWARNKAENYLIAQDSEEYNYYLANKDKVVELTPGAYFKDKTRGLIYRFEGKFAYNTITSEQTDPYRYNYYNQRPRSSTDKITIITTITRDHDRPVFVYTYWVVDKDGYANKNTLTQIEIRKSKINNLIAVDDNSIIDQTIKTFKLPVGQILTRYYPDSKRPASNYYVRSSIGSYGDNYILYNTKQEALNDKITEEQMFKACTPLIDSKLPEYYGGLNPQIEYVFKDVKK